MNSTDATRPSCIKPAMAKVWAGLLRFATIIGLRAKRSADDARLMELIALRYRGFNTLLTANNELLEIIADLEGLERGDKVFGRALLRNNVTAALAATRLMVSGLQTISGGRHRALSPVLEALESQLQQLVAERALEAPEAWTIPLSGVDRGQAAFVGGKMANLGEIRNRAGLPAPEGFAITTAAARHFLGKSGLVAVIREALDAVTGASTDEVSRRIQGAILRAEVPADLATVIRDAYEQLPSTRGRPRVSLRSSAVKEDTEASFAGQYATVLNVAPEGVLDAYRQVVASLYSPQAIFYRMHMGIREDEVAMAVGCVAMVDALAAGVAFSRDPVNPTTDDVVIHAVWGLGPSVVDGRVSPDIYRISRQDWTAKAVIGHKGSQLVVDPEAGIHEELVQEEMQGGACLEPSEIETLGHWVERLEDHFGGPQDVEWALDRHCRLVLLQSRPMQKSAVQAGGKTEPVAGFDMLLEGGETAVPGVGHGVAVHVRTAKDLASFPKGGVLVARHSSPEYVQVMDRAAAIVTDVGSTIGHMASLAREFGIPALLDAKVATKMIPGGDEVTVDARQGRVYLGRVTELLGEEAPRAFMKGTPLFHDLEAVARLIVPLNLVSPDAPSFRPEECRTLHDIARFVHEKAFAEMFRIGALIDSLPSQAVQLDVPLPIDLYIIDLGGGLAVAPGQRRVKRQHITSYPLAQLVKGMLHEGIPRFGARPMDAGGFLDVMFRHAMSNPEGDPSFHQPSYAIVSDKYLNFASRVGYHFSALDCFCGKTTSKNYISFRFKGGAAEVARRARRVRVIGEILSEMGFKATVREDLLYARVQKYSWEEIGEKIEMVGQLFQFFRQMDLAMVSEAEADYYRDAFLQGNYALDPSFRPAGKGGKDGQSAG